MHKTKLIIRFVKNSNSKNKLKELRVQKKLREKKGVSWALIRIRRRQIGAHDGREKQGFGDSPVPSVEV